MPSGTSDSRLTNKTEFMRYLNAHPGETKSLSAKAKEYEKLFIRGDKFGDWLRQRHLAHFAQAYHKWWLKHPELYGKIYEQQDSLSV